MVSRVRIGFDDDPSRRVAYAQVQHLALGYEMVETLHDLFDTGGEVPVVHVQDIDVRGLELLERCLNTESERFGVVGAEVGLLQCRLGHDLVRGRVLGGNDHLISSVWILGHPFANPGFGLLVLVVVGTVKENLAGSWFGWEWRLEKLPGAQG